MSVVLAHDLIGDDSGYTFEHVVFDPCVWLGGSVDYPGRHLPNDMSASNTAGLFCGIQDKLLKLRARDWI
jgi:hypothetical protein